METFLGKKPYDFVPLVSECKKYKIKGHNDFENNTYSGKLYLEIDTLSPIHISQGLLGVNDSNQVFNKTMRRDNKVIIPGSSIKGVIRSISEAISKSCAPQLPGRERRLEKALVNNKTQCDDINKACPTCNMYGMTSRNSSYRGKIMFGEFVLEQKTERDNLEYVQMPSLDAPFKDYPRRNKIFDDRSRNYGNERLYYCDVCNDKTQCKTCSKKNYFDLTGKAGTNRSIKFRGRKFYFHNYNNQETNKPNRSSLYEVVRKGSTFKGSVTFENLTKEELQILAYSLGLTESFKPKLGYGKPAYYGSIQIKLEEVEDLLARYSKSKSFDKEDIINMAKEYRKDSTVEIRNVMDKLEEILGQKQGPKWQSIDGNKVY